MAYFVGSLLRLPCQPTSENDDVVVDEIDFISYSIDRIDAS
jgi:hypothetical protein